MPQLARHFSSLCGSQLLPRRCAPCPGVVSIHVWKGQCRSIATESPKELLYQVPRLHEDVEDVEKYAKGIFHPIHLGDTFECGRYCVLHKLGFSGNSTAWLARGKAKDRLVSLRVFTAEASRGQNELRLLQHLDERSGYDLRQSSIIATLDKFIFDGPNGTHHCHVSQPGGPSVFSIVDHWDDVDHFDNCRFRARLARRIARQLARAVALLHDVGIVHGDIKPENVLLQLRGIDDWSVETVLQTAWPPSQKEIFMSSGLEPGPSAPRYLVKSASFIAVDTKYVSEQAVLVDLGKAFPELAMASTGVGTALSYCSPELTLESKASKASDVWALACTVFEIRSGFKLFEEDIYTDAMYSSREIPENILRAIGPPPESSHLLWDKYGIDAYTIKESGYNKLSERVNEINAHDRLKPLFIRDGDAAPTCHHAALQEPLGRRLSDKEEIELGDLLRRTLRYTPENRLSANQVANHSWFTLDSE